MHDKDRVDRGYIPRARRWAGHSQECKMPKEELLQFEGLVTEILPDARYRVQLDNGRQLVPTPPEE